MKCCYKCSGLHIVFIHGITINVLRGIHPVVFAVYVFMRICMIFHLDLCGVYLWWKINLNGPYSLKGIVHVKIKMLFTHPYYCICILLFFLRKIKRCNLMNIQIFSRQRKFVVITSCQAPRPCYHSLAIALMDINNIKSDWFSRFMITLQNCKQTLYLITH